MMLPDKAQQLLHEFTAVASWEQRMRLLMKYGQQLPALNIEQQIDLYKVQGCESQVWLISECNNDVWQFSADSDAKIVKGLLAVLLARVNGLTTAQIQQLDLDAWFIQLGLAKQLSSSRRDGLKAIFKQIKELTVT